MALQDLHWGVETFGDAVIAQEAPHAGDLGRPGVQGAVELVDGAQEPGCELLALLAGAVLLQPEGTEALFKAIDHLQGRGGG